MPLIANHKHKIEEKSIKSFRFSSKVVGLGLADLWEFPTLPVNSILQFQFQGLQFQFQFGIGIAINSNSGIDPNPDSNFALFCSNSTTRNKFQMQ